MLKINARMFQSAFAVAVFALGVSVSSFGMAELKTGAAAPEFSLKDAAGKDVKLSSLKGKYVVLEWLNHGCPFVRKHYDSGNMQKLQATYTGKGVAWYSVVSSAPGKEGYVTPKEAAEEAKKNASKATGILLDSDGKVGQAYGAKTTPHLFIVNPEGKLVYQGAIDDKSSTEVEDVKTANNYVSAALDAAMAGKAVATASTKPYGCSVKYKH